MFKTGDKVVHPKHGSGVVTDRRTMMYQDAEREYFCIELMDGRGSVMIPVDRVEETGLREPIRDTGLIMQVMNTTPEVLTDDNHLRQTGIETRISSGSALLLIQVLRDLCWRETTQHLSPTDKKLKESVLAKLMQELAMNRTLIAATIKPSIETIIQQSMEMHLANAENAAATGNAGS